MYRYLVISRCLHTLHTLHVKKHLFLFKHPSTGSSVVYISQEKKNYRRLSPPFNGT